MCSHFILHHAPLLGGRLIKYLVGRKVSKFCWRHRLGSSCRIEMKTQKSVFS